MCLTMFPDTLTLLPHCCVCVHMDFLLNVFLCIWYWQGYQTLFFTTLSALIWHPVYVFMIMTRLADLFTILWTFIWFLHYIGSDALNRIAHLLNCFSSVCRPMSAGRLPNTQNCLPHCVHSYGYSRVYIVVCLAHRRTHTSTPSILYIHMASLMYVFSHDWQGY